MAVLPTTPLLEHPAALPGPVSNLGGSFLFLPLVTRDQTLAGFSETSPLLSAPDLPFFFFKYTIPHFIIALLTTIIADKKCFFDKKVCIFSFCVSFALRF